MAMSEGSPWPSQIRAFKLLNHTFPGPKGPRAVLSGIMEVYARPRELHPLAPRVTLSTFSNVQRALRAASTSAIAILRG